MRYGQYSVTTINSPLVRFSDSAGSVRPSWLRQLAIIRPHLIATNKRISDRTRTSARRPAALNRRSGCCLQSVHAPFAATCLRVSERARAPTTGPSYRRWQPDVERLLRLTLTPSGNRRASPASAPCCATEPHLEVNQGRCHLFVHCAPGEPARSAAGLQCAF